MEPLGGVGGPLRPISEHETNNMTTTHPSKPSGASQCDKILRALQNDHGEWIDMPSLAAVSKAYAVHSRINDLRQRGYKIEHYNLVTGRVVRSYYRLIA